MSVKPVLPLIITLTASATTLGADITLEDFNNNSFTTNGGFTFDSFDGNVTETADSVIIDVSGFGGMGNGLALQDIDATTHLLKITLRTVAGNVAGDFRIILVDEDGDDSGPGLGNEDYQFLFSLAGVGETDFVTLEQKLDDPGPVFRQKSFGSTNDGDSVQNYGLVLWQLQSAFGSTDRLHIEVDKIEIVEIPEPGSLGLIGLGLLSLISRRR